ERLAWMGHRGRGDMHQTFHSGSQAGIDDRSGPSDVDPLVLVLGSHYVDLRGEVDNGIVSGHGGPNSVRVGDVGQHFWQPEIGGAPLQDGHGVAPVGQGERDSTPQHPGSTRDQYPHAGNLLRTAHPGAGEYSAGPAGESRSVDLRSVSD